MKRGAIVMMLGLGMIVSAGRVHAQKIGDPAAELSVTKWVKGEAFDLASCKGKNLVVVEFWATWCGPCIAAMPHLTELQKKYEKDGVIFVGVTAPDPNNSLDQVERFVKDKGDTIGYRIAFDGESKTYASYMKAFGKGGIPQSFLIDREGKVVWEGHPTELDKALEEQVLVASKYDPVTYKKVVQIRELRNKYFALAVSAANKGTVRTLGKQIILQGVAVPELLAEFAAEIVAKTELKVRDLDQAEEAAKKAVETSKNADAGILATYAHVLYANKKPAEAVAQQKKAIEACKDAGLKAQFAERLAAFESGKP
ncbi:MAG: Thiol-disulfide oxidoreductase ResA [Phycisphaerae bacterium]|nr:Thiol-disulfide oxidoreductase ResA [Phycisphaerae bacterium]